MKEKIKKLRSSFDQMIGILENCSYHAPNACDKAINELNSTLNQMAFDLGRTCIAGDL